MTWQEITQAVETKITPPVLICTAIGMEGIAYYWRNELPLWAKVGFVAAGVVSLGFAGLIAMAEKQLDALGRPEDQDY